MKRFINALLAFVLFVSMSTPMSFAQMSSSDVIDMVNDANDRIVDCVDRAQDRAEDADKEALAIIIAELIAETNGIAQETADKAAEEGYKVEFGYTTYKIGGIKVEIDPMTVH